MSAEALELLLERLCQGDAEAAQQIFREYEPYLRLIVRRRLPAHLRARFDSLDIVQSVWSDLWTGFCQAGWRFRDADHLRAFLMKATRNRFLDRVRQHQRSAQREQAMAAEQLAERAVAGGPSPSETVQAQELWEELLALCPPEHRELLRLKREGLRVAEIAARTGLHPSSVRRILYELARRLAAKRAAAGDRGPAP